MTPLPPPHHHRLTAAEGWLELGLPAEAQSELDALPVAFQSSPAVLHAQYAICAHRLEWDTAFDIAERHVQLHPHEVSGWIHRAYAARRKPGGGLTEAFELLRPAADHFPEEAVVPYNLACYCAQQAELNQAWKWLERATKIGGAELIRGMALADADLCPLWPRIAELK